MSEQKDVREQTNPIFNTAKAMLLHYCIAGDPDAPALAKKFGIDADSLIGTEEQKVALSPELTVMVETRFRASNSIAANYKNSTVMDIACGYTPRALNEAFRDMHYIGCDLPVVTEELAPVYGEVFAERGIIKNKEFHAADATNYRSLRDALDSVNGKITILTDGLLTYFNNSELTELCTNIRRLLAEFGGRWITSDPDMNPLFMAALTAVRGKAALADLLKAKDAYEGQSDTNMEVQNMTVLAFDYENSMNTVTNFLRTVGLKWEIVPMADYVTEVHSLAGYPDETKAAYLKSLENVHIWIFTPDENYKEAEADYDGEAFGLKARVRGGTMDIALRGRLDTLTAPALLEKFESVKEGVTACTVNMKELDYVSSAGLRVLLMMYKALDGNMKLENVNDEVKEILEVTGFGQYFLQEAAPLCRAQKQSAAAIF